MLLLLPLLAIAVFLALWLMRRGSTLTRQCVWRQHRAEGLWRCAACGAETPDSGKPPRHCLRAPVPLGPNTPG